MAGPTATRGHGAPRSATAKWGKKWGRVSTGNGAWCRVDSGAAVASADGPITPFPSTRAHSDYHLHGDLRYRRLARETSYVILGESRLHDPHSATGKPERGTQRKIHQNWPWSGSGSAALAPGAADGAALAPRPSRLRGRQGGAPRHAPCSERKHAQPRARRFLEQAAVGDRLRGGRDGRLRRRRGLRARGASRLSPWLRVSLCAPNRALDSAEREQAGQERARPQEGRFFPPRSLTSAVGGRACQSSTSSSSRWSEDSLCGRGESNSHNRQITRT